MQSDQIENERRRRIQLAAYYLWQQRGCPFGTPTVDWLQAETQLLAGSKETSPKPALVAAAEVIGSALGSVAGLMASVSDLVQTDETAKLEPVHTEPLK